MCVPLMVSCSGFGLPLHAQLLRLFVTTQERVRNSCEIARPSCCYCAVLQRVVMGRQSKTGAEIPEGTHTHKKCQPPRRRPTMLHKPPIATPNQGQIISVRVAKLGLLLRYIRQGRKVQDLRSKCNTRAQRARNTGTNDGRLAFLVRVCL